RAQAARARDQQGTLAPLEPERAQKARQAVEVIAMQVGDQDRVEPRQRKARALRRELRAFAAVAERPAAWGRDRERGGAAEQRGSARRRAERDRAELHPLCVRHGPPAVKARALPTPPPACRTSTGALRRVALPCRRRPRGLCRSRGAPAMLPRV